VRIPGKAIRVPEPRRSAFLRKPIRRSERSDAGEVIEEEVIGIVKPKVGSRRLGGRSPERSGGRWDALKLRLAEGQPRLDATNFCNHIAIS
jgi:hypothetical protein